MQFTRMVCGKSSQHPAAFLCHLQLNTPAIVEVLNAVDQTPFLAALAEFDHAMMPQAQPFRRIRHGRLFSVRNSCKLQEQLMLLRVEAGIGRPAFAVLQKTAQFVPEAREIAQAGLIFRR